MLFTLCIIHREHLAATKPPADFKSVLDKVVKTFYDVRSPVLNSRLFKTLCENMVSYFEQRVHTEAR